MRRLAALLFALPLAAALCPEGAVQGTRPEDCYLYGDGQSWQEAEQYCASNKGHLSSVPNAVVNAFLIRYPKALESAHSYWLGASSPPGSLGVLKLRSLGLTGATDKWTWTDGSNFAYTNWAAGQSDHGCLSVNASTGQWFSGDCNASKPFVCKVPPGCKPAPQKCDDGWTFNERLNKCYKAS